MRIIIDGDGSPVKQETIKIAEQYNIQVLIVTSISHYTSDSFPENVSFIYVERGKEVADYRIFELVQPGDLVITQDYGLASLVLPKCAVMHHTGKIFNAFNIDQLLQQRYYNQQLRRHNKHTKGPKAFTKEKAAKFEKALVSFIEDNRKRM